TSKGYKKALKRFDNGCQEVLHLNIKFTNFDVEIKGTEDHKIKTTKGWKKLGELKQGDVLYVQSDLMEKSIIYSKEKNIFAERLKGELKDYIEPFGNTTTEKSHQDSTYT